ncbi:MAG: HAMP domain-containing histidine kinase [Euryarchaeota archaeon]|nr:HAMP domain-containing histidine kinase [Euryarchaeota archaeon]
MADWEFIRTAIMTTGWPVLLVGSFFLLRRTIKFHRDVGRSSFGRLVLVMVSGWLVTMYGLGVTASAFMITNPTTAVPIVVPVFGAWLALMAVVGWSVGRWTDQVASINRFYLRLDDANKTKNEIINRASHELSTPITPLKIQVALLRRPELGALTAKQERALDIISRNVDRLSFLVQEMMEVARFQGGHLLLSREPVEVGEMVQEAVDSFGPAAAAANVTVVTRIDERVQVEADPIRISQVLQIILSNAIKFTPAGGTVTVSCGRKYDRAAVLVEDTGAGFRMEDVPRLFQPFGQLHAERSNQAAGGLGLYIARSLIDAHDGSIWAESPGPGHGATFGFSLALLGGPSGSGATKDSGRRSDGPARTEIVGAN